MFSGWQENTEVGSKESSWRFDCLKQAEYWTDTHFWAFEYGRETKSQREHQILVMNKLLPFWSVWLNFNARYTFGKKRILEIVRSNIRSTDQRMTVKR